MMQDHLKRKSRKSKISSRTNIFKYAMYPSPYKYIKNDGFLLEPVKTRFSLPASKRYSYMKFS